MQYVHGQCLSQYLLFPVLQRCDLLSRAISILGLITQNGLYGEKIKDQIWRPIFFVIFLSALQQLDFLHFFPVLFCDARLGLTHNSMASFLKGQPLPPLTAVDNVLDWHNFLRFFIVSHCDAIPYGGCIRRYFFNLWDRNFLGDPIKSRYPDRNNSA